MASQAAFTPRDIFVRPKICRSDFSSLSLIIKKKQKKNKKKPELQSSSHTYRQYFDWIETKIPIVLRQLLQLEYPDCTMRSNFDILKNVLRKLLRK